MADKKKSWYVLKAPSLFDEREIGNTLVMAPEDALNRYVVVNAMTLLGDMKKQSQLLKFKISSVKDKKCLTEIDGFSIMPATLKRLVRRNRDRIDLSFIAPTKDGVMVRIKPLLITRSLTSRSVRTDLHHAAKKAIHEYVAEKEFDDCVGDVMQGALQAHVKSELHSIYPLRSVEMKIFERVHSKN